MKTLFLYLERIDPYFTQRLILYKALYIATIMTYVGWVVHIENQFAAYMYPVALIGAVYESALFTSYKEKKQVFFVAFTTAALGSVLFYQTFQYKFIFMFIFLGFLNTLYFLFGKFLPKAKPFIVLIIVVCGMNMSSKPSGVLQHSVDIFSVMILSALVSYLCIISFPNIYHKIWIRAFGLYVNAVRNVLIDRFTMVDHRTFVLGSSHMNIMRSYRRLLKKKLFFKATRAGFSIGNILAVLCCLEFNDNNRMFWENVSICLRDFHLSIKMGHQFELNNVSGYDCRDKVQQYFIKHFSLSIKNWNELCKLI